MRFTVNIPLLALNGVTGDQIREAGVSKLALRFEVEADTIDTALYNTGVLVGLVNAEGESFSIEQIAPPTDPFDPDVL